MRAARRQIGDDVRRQIEDCALCEQTFARLAGRKLEGCTCVEIGAGQSLRRARVFAVKNDVTATDLDVYAAGWDLPAYLRVLKRNGPKRLIKTIGLRMLGTDGAFDRALVRELNLPALPQPAFRQMDATRLDFPDNSVDLVYSYQVFEHIPDPELVWRESMRVVKPGGCVFTLLHLYTSDSGCHDLRIIRNDHSQTGYWPHLRPSAKSLVQNSAYLNELTLAQWTDLIGRVFGATDIEYQREEHLRTELEKLRAAGELKGFTDDELLVRNIVVAWVKPR
jgi:SAM-dependent methyltransferase